jgi:cell division-specific peptidoglycan biosynthesis regulator FtsW
LIFNKTGQSPDKKLLITILVLMAFGLIMTFSASAHLEGTPKVIKQGIYIGLGLIAGFFVLKTPISFF